MKNSNIKLWSVGVGLVFLLAAVGYMQRPALKDWARSMDRRIKVWRRGEEPFTKLKIDQQGTLSSGAAISTTQSLETAVLPLRIESVNITAKTRFPLGAGSMTEVDGVLIVMDRLGTFYGIDGISVDQISIPHVPNGLDDFIKFSDNKALDTDTFRTHSIAYSSKDRRLYASYEKFVSPGMNRFEISSIVYDPKTRSASGPWVSIYKTSEFPSSSFGLAGGGKILAAANRLFFSVGDYGFYSEKSKPTQHAAQNPTSPFGKIYEIHPDGRVEMLSRGHRNTQGLVLSSAGQLINVEQGPQGGDELNIIEKGGNYGWPIDTFGTDYGKYTWQYQTKNSDAGLKLPLYSFVPSVAADSIIQVNQFHERWNGDFLIGSLKAQTLFRMKIEEGRVLMSEPIWIGHRIREIVELNRQIVLFTDDGLVMRISVDAATVKQDSRAVDTVASKAVSKCLACHHMGSTNPSHLAPTLSDIGSRPVASDTYAKYSDALRKAGGSWTRERVKAFIQDPTKVVPGTGMPKPDVTPDELSEIVNTLFSTEKPMH